MSLSPSRRVLHGALLSTAIAAANVQAGDFPPVIQKLEQQGVEVIDSFEAPGGMTGYVGEMRGRSLAFYLTPDGDHVIVGTLMDEPHDGPAPLRPPNSRQPKRGG
ncbi:hypothetical protein [Marinobacter metalliresistant]|uniref:Thiol:disulfide interchange protein DsbG n=1 Tax=Marinobacter metalliresistant TaxID=2961995 RepID=A0ABZ2VY79_9GAMM